MCTDKISLVVKVLLQLLHLTFFFLFGSTHSYFRLFFRTNTYAPCTYFQALIIKTLGYGFHFIFDCFEKCLPFSGVNNFYVFFNKYTNQSVWEVPSGVQNVFLFKYLKSNWTGGFGKSSLIIIIGEFASNKRASCCLGDPLGVPGGLGPLGRFSRRVCLLWFEEARESTRYFTTVMNNGLRYREEEKTTWCFFKR